MAGGDVTTILDEVSSAGLARGISKLIPEVAGTLLPPLTARSVLSLTPSIAVDWSARLAEAQRMPTLFDADVMAKHQRLCDIVQDFFHSARHWAKVIVDELSECGGQFVGMLVFD